MEEKSMKVKKPRGRDGTCRGKLLNEYFNCDRIGHYASKCPYESEYSYDEEDYRNEESKKKFYYKEDNSSSDDCGGDLDEFILTNYHLKVILFEN